MPLFTGRLGVIADELGDDLDTALSVASRLGLSAVELRTIEGTSWVLVDDITFERAIAGVRSARLEIPVLASPIFKCALDGAPEPRGAALHGAPGVATLAEHRQLLRRAIARAAVAGVPCIRGFSCWRVERPESVLAEVADVLAEAMDEAAAGGVELLLENEHDCNVATAPETAALLDRVPGLRVIWDPANHVRAGGDPAASCLDGYEDRIAHVHLKDVDAEGRWVGLGQGLVPYDALIDRLLEAGYDGSFSLETHCELDGSRVAATEAAVELLRERELVA